MPDKPAAELTIDEPLVRHLLRTQAHGIPDAAILPLVHADDGWDCSVWRLGAGLAVRLPRRGVAAPLVRHEQLYLPEIAERFPPGVGVPAPVLAGAPDTAFPWPWSVVPWFDGETGLHVPRGERGGWAKPLADALGALHVPAADPYPANPFRGVPLADRDDAVQMRLIHQRDVGLGAEALAVLEARWMAGLKARPWSAPPLWIHGDLHPGNLIARGGMLTAIIDFGDLTAGDPAYDLAVGRLALDRGARAVFRVATGWRYDDDTWVRAEAWAAAITLMLLTHSDDNPAYAALGRECLAEFTE